MKINNLLVKRALLKEELEHYYNEKSKRKEYGQKWIHATFNLKQELVFFKKYVCSLCEDTNTCKVITTAMLGRCEGKVNGVGVSYWL